jgi:anti-sigma regulatory factor (Ser/Thr protein kinase)
MARTPTHAFELTDAKTSLMELLDGLERLVVARMKSDAAAGEIRLMAEEALTNVMKYGYDDSKRPSILAEVQVAIHVQEVVLEIRDRGTAFDPLSAPSPDVDAPPESRKEGGLGILLLRTFADEVHYRREGDANVLSLKKRLG